MWTKNNFLYEKSVVWEDWLEGSFQQANLFFLLTLMSSAIEVVNMC